MESIYISTEFIKLGQFLKLCGEAGSGSEARIMIESGLVRVNGEKIFLRGKKVFPGDIIIAGPGKEYEVTGGK